MHLPLLIYFMGLFDGINNSVSTTAPPHPHIMYILLQVYGSQTQTKPAYHEWHRWCIQIIHDSSSVLITVTELVWEGGGGEKWYVFGSEISTKQEVQTIFHLKVVNYIQ
jgi:hypothetical protein